MANEKVTLKEIAQRTGVSLVTVHRAIYGKSGISEKTRQKILDEVKRSNYQVDETASALKRHAKKVVVVLPKPEGDERFYFRKLWDAIHEAAKEMEAYKIYFEYIESSYPLSEMDKELEVIYDNKLEEMDGLITIADGEQENIWISRFAKRDIPIALLSSYYVGESPMVTCIKGDHECCGLLAAEYLIHGLKSKDGKILFLSGNEQIYSNGVYAHSFIKEMKKYGHEIIKIPGFSRKEIEQQCVKYLKEENIQGIFACNARNTYSLCEILKEHNMGKDILVIGTDIFNELEEYFENDILDAVICQYQWEQGKCAVKKIQEHLSRGSLQNEAETLPPVLLMKSNYKYFL